MFEDDVINKAMKKLADISNSIASGLSTAGHAVADAGGKALDYLGDIPAVQNLYNDRSNLIPLDAQESITRNTLGLRDMAKERIEENGAPDNISKNQQIIDQLRFNMPQIQDFFEKKNPIDALVRDGPKPEPKIPLEPRIQSRDSARRNIVTSMLRGREIAPELGHVPKIPQDYRAILKALYKRTEGKDTEHMFEQMMQNRDVQGFMNSKSMWGRPQYPPEQLDMFRSYDDMMDSILRP